MADPMQKKCSSLSFIGKECAKLVNPRNASDSRIKQVKSKNHWQVSGKKDRVLQSD